VRHGNPEWAAVGLVNDVRVGLREGEFILAYQPKICLGTGELLAVEALVRWRHPFYGLLQPQDFVPQIEASALIREFSRHVLQHAVVQCAAWRADGHNLPMSVNVSARNLLEPDFPEYLAQLLDRHRLPAHRLTLEIAETAELHRADAKTNLRALRDRGTRLSLDDFGTGYSSLSILTQLPLDELKIDRSFVHSMLSRPTASAIVGATIDLAHALDLQVTAVGVETTEHIDRLMALGCDNAQGFLFGRPVEALDPALLESLGQPHTMRQRRRMPRFRGRRDTWPAAHRVVDDGDEDTAS
jgi:EAL domain-containing protein (putative c-di-GMP-specific phosphodiesterase class I)